MAAKKKKIDCSKPPCKTAGLCCDKKKKQIEECCSKDDSCLSASELDGMKNDYNNGVDSVRTKGKSYESPFSDRKFLKTYVNKLYGDEKPERAECAKKRKCLLVPYNNADNVCCEGMTGHHIVPGSALRDSLPNCYNHSEALTTCVVGMSNHKGLHGFIHMRLRDAVKKIRKQKDTPCKVKYSKLLSASVDSFDETTNYVCDRKCIEKELKENLESQCPDSFANGAERPSPNACNTCFASRRCLKRT